MSFFPAYVKVARTTNSNYYNVNIDWTTEQFITEMNAWVLRDFNLSNVEYVYAFYYDNVTRNGVGAGAGAAEDAPAIVSSNYATLRMLYNISNLIFYIRPLVNNNDIISRNNGVIDHNNGVIDHNNGVIDHNNVIIDHNNGVIINNGVVSPTILCITCDTNQRNILFGPCNHLCVCSGCNINSIINCPICRSPIINRTRIFIP